MLPATNTHVLQMQSLHRYIIKSKCIGFNTVKRNNYIQVYRGCHFRENLETSPQMMYGMYVNGVHRVHTSFILPLVGFIQMGIFT